MGDQIHSIEYVLQWFRQGEPFLDDHQIKVPRPMQWIDEIYKRRMEGRIKIFCDPCNRTN